MENAKTLILNNKKNPNFKAVLNLKNYDYCAIKFFNMANNDKNFALGIKQKTGVIKIPLQLNSGKGEFVLPKKIDLEDNMVCAVVDVSNAFCPEIVLSGSINNAIENTTIENAFVQSKPDDVSVLYEIEESEQIENLIDKNLDDDLNTTYFDSCANCKYRKAFYEGGECACIKSQQTDENNNFELTDNTIKNYSTEQIVSNIEQAKNVIEEDNIEESESFYLQIKNQLNSLFNKYQKHDLLERIIPNSKWVKVDYDQTENFYVIGLIYDGNNQDILYISYGVPSKDFNNPPEDLKEYAQWLPIDFNKPKDEGFWIVYQDAKDGQTLKIDFI